MGQIVETTLKIFDGGMTNDSRDDAVGVARIVRNFNNYLNSKKLTQHRSMKVDAATESQLDAQRIHKFAVAADGNMYGVGFVSAIDGHTQVYKKGLDPTGFWGPALGTSTSSSSVETGLALNAYQNYLYGINTGGVWKYGDVTGSQAFVYNEYTTHIPTGEPCVHSKDDNQYWPSNNLVIVNNSGSWSVGVTLPVGFQIRSLCEYGNYLGIGGDMLDGSIVVYLWDRDTSLETLSEKIDWGVGSLKVLESIGGVLTGISVNTPGGNSLIQINPHLEFKYYSTTPEVIVFAEFECTFASVISGKQKFNNILYFLAEVTFNGENLHGLWKIFKKKTGEMTVSFDRTARNDTDLTATGTLLGFYKWGDYVFIAYLIPTTLAYTVWRTDDQAFYNITAIFETIKFNSGDASLMKDLIGATLNFEALPANAAVALAYRLPGETNFTELFTYDTDNGTTHSAVNIEATGAKVPQHTEIEWHLEATEGAEIIGLSFQEEVTGKKPFGI